VSKKLLKHGLVVLLILIFLIPGNLALADTTVKAKNVQIGLYLDGESIWCDKFLISGDYYCRLNDLAGYFSGTTSQFNVTWNNKKKAINITTGKEYTSSIQQDFIFYIKNKNYNAKTLSKKVYVNGKLKNIKGYSIDGSDYFKIKDLSKIIPFDMEMSSDKKEIFLFSKTPKNAHRVIPSYQANTNSASSSFARWSSPLKTYLISNDDNTISVIEANETLNIETYDENYKLISKKKLDYELPLFGGFYSGEKYNYIAYGDTNTEEDDNKEVIRIVKYNKKFKRIDSVSIKGGESITYVPFDAGCGRMSEQGNQLVFHTSRLRYTTSDGKNHQSQLTIVVDTSSMTVLNYLGEFQENHVSHSFDQYVQFDGDTYVLIDHGDAYPRSVVLHKISKDVDYDEYREYGIYEDKSRIAYDRLNLFNIPGASGANCTGVSIGGFEVSSDNYIVAINSVDHSLVTEYTNFSMKGLETDQRDIIICTLPKNSTEDSKVKQIILAEYTGTDKIASIPQIVKISKDKFMVLWQEFSLYNSVGNLKYVFLDKAGKPITKVKSVKNFRLSKCKPIVIDNEVVWYTNEKGCRIFYTIPLN
jgi:hypothetical protein